MKFLFYLATISLLLCCKSSKPQISKIEFSADACFGTCPIFTMSILSDGTATYNAKEYNPRKGKFKTTINKLQLDSLISLINKADILSLKDKYSTDWTDHPTYNFTVLFQNGQKKTINDYGPSGPNNLKEVYDFVFSLRESQNWK